MASERAEVDFIDEDRAWPLKPARAAIGGASAARPVFCQDDLVAFSHFTARFMIVRASPTCGHPRRVWNM